MRALERVHDDAAIGVGTEMIPGHRWSEHENTLLDGSAN